MKYVTLVKLSDDGRKRFPEASKLFAEVLGITDKLGGKIFETYALAGRYDFVSIAEYPTPEIAFEARIKMIEMGIFEYIEGFEAFEMDLFLSKV
jgi:uncharacterized protein with GYD domain